MNDKKKQCANCGGIGHVYKKCNHPLISFGIICFRVNENTIQYLLVQRKDSLSFAEFLRGKYDINQCKYLLRLFSNMTETEITNIFTLSFDQLWKILWQTNSCRGFQKEYMEAKRKFEALKKGFHVKDPQTNKTYFFGLEYIEQNVTGTLTEPEWGFPKGRRNINEHDIICACREFKEETGIHPSCITLIPNCKPFEEIFSGSNNVMYKHVYYIAVCNNKYSNNYLFNPKNKVQSREIQDMKWMSYQEAQNNILQTNVERKELFKRVNNMLVKKYSNIIYG